MPNTVTKTLHTDKVYDPDISRFSVEAYPFYASLSDQVRTILSQAAEGQIPGIEGPVFRLQREQDIPGVFQTAQAQMVGGAIGAVLAEIRRGVGEYPVHRRVKPSGHGLPAAYGVAADEGVQGGFHKAQAEVGQIVDAVHRVAQLLHGVPAHAGEIAHQHLPHLGAGLREQGRDSPDAFCPDKGSCMSYDLSRAASTYLDNDIEMLKRLQANFKIVIG